MDIDHVVLWVESPKRALEFYVGVLGLAPVRARDFKEERASFPSVRLNETTILDLMDRSKVSGVRKFTGGGGDSGGAPLNHVCLSMDASDYASLTARLVEHGVELMSGGGEIVRGPRPRRALRILPRPGRQCFGDTALRPSDLNGVSGYNVRFWLLADSHRAIDSANLIVIYDGTAQRRIGSTSYPCPIPSGPPCPLAWPCPWPQRAAPSSSRTSA